MTQQLPPGVSFAFLGEGKVGPLIRARDWSTTSIGPMESWPTTLKSYVSMILTLPTPAIIFWGEDQVQLYNDGYSTIMGPRHPQHLGSSYRECWPDTYPTIYPWMERVLRNGEVVEVERTLITLTRHGFNEEAFFSFTFSPLRNDHGQIAGILQIVTEMTETVLTERRLETLEALAPSYGAEPADAQQNAIRVLANNPSDIRFALLFARQDDTRETPTLSHSIGIENAHSGWAGSDALNRVVREVFRSGRAIQIEEVQKILPHDPTPPWPEATQKALALPLSRSMAETPRGVLVLGISPRLRFDQKYREFLESVTREIAIAMAAVQERARQERAKEELYQFFMQAPAPMVVLLGPEHRFALVNPPLEQLVGRRNLVGKTILEAFAHSEVGGFVERLDAVYRTGQAFVGHELPLSLPDENGVVQDRFISVGYQPYRNPDGHIEGVLAIHQDVTEQVVARKKVEKLAEELHEAVRARDEFMSIASHELKTPLSSLKLQCQMRRRALQKGDPTVLLEGVASKFVDQTEKQVGRLIRLVDDMLDVARVQTGRLAIQPEKVDLGALVVEALEKLRPQLMEAGTPSTFEQPHEPIEGLWDRMRLEQVVTNLFTNAMRYGNRKPIVVRLQRKADRALLMVQDQGIGIPKEAQSKIFNRFERAVAASEVSGLGLGLYITHQIVKSHGGSIWIESEVGRGSTFFVELPLTPDVSDIAAEGRTLREEARVP